MKFKFFTFIQLFLSLCTISYAQMAPVAIGDKFPDISISKALNFKNPTFKLADYKGKLVILDFWATWCRPCLAMMPKIDSLQKEFNGKLEFLPVTEEDEKIVKAFLKKFEISNGITIPSVTNDTLLNSLFPHSSIPYYVWIDQTGTIIATTEATEVNSRNINTVLNKRPINLDITIGAQNRRLNYDKPIFVVGMPFINKDQDSADVAPVADNEILQQSILTKYRPQVKLHIGLDSNHFEATNENIMNFYQVYFGIAYYKYYTEAFWNRSRFKVEIKDPVLRNKIISYENGKKYINWLKDNGYCYELNWRNVKNWHDKYKLLGDDLDRYFARPLGFTAAIEKRLAPCDILIVTDKTKLVTVGGQSFERHDAFSYYQQNLPISQLMNRLNNFWQGSDRPLINETNFPGNIDIQLNCKMNNIQDVNNELAKFGLKLIKGDRMADVLVIKDKI